MPLNFPNSPTDGELYTDTASGNRWVWDNANTVWKSTSTFTQTITVSSTQPGSPVVGQLWWSQDYGRLFVYYNDGNSSQWVEANPADQTAGLVFNTANAAYGRANTALQNTSGTFAGTLSVTGNVSINTSDSWAKFHIGLDSTTSASAKMSANVVNEMVRLNAPYGFNPASVPNAGAKWGIRLSGSNDSPYTDGQKSACIYAVSEDTFAGYNRQVGLAFHTSGFDTGNVERMRIDGNGRITMPYQPIFSVRKSDGGATYSGTFIGNVVDVNVGSHYNTTNGRFTAPVAGTYFFSVFALFSSGGTDTGQSFVFYKNGAATGVIPYTRSTGAQYTQCGGTCMFTLAAGDYIQVLTDGGTWYATGAMHNTFCGHLIG
jgi:hypothetical protein